MAPATPTWPSQLRGLTKLIPSKVGPLVAGAERAVLNPWHLTHAKDLEQMRLAIFPENTQQNLFVMT